MIGRRQSLAAQSVIAVSASGFTKGAQRKAAAHGLALRDLRKLTDGEIAAWRQSIGITVICYQYSEIELTLWFDDPAQVALDELRREFPRHPIKLTLFNRANRFLTDNRMMTVERANENPIFGITLAETPDHEIVLGGGQVRLIEMKGRARAVHLPLECPRVEAYGSPDARNADAVVERFALGQTSIVHDRDRIAVLLDISTIDLPPLCQFVGVETVTGGREVPTTSDWSLWAWRNCRLSKVRFSWLFVLSRITFHARGNEPRALGWPSAVTVASSSAG